MEAVVSEEIAAAAGDLHYWQERAVRAEFAAARAEADTAALKAALDEAIALCHFPEHAQDDRWYARLDAASAALATDHPGAALLAEREAARKLRQTVTGGDPQAVLDAIAAYDQVVKGGSAGEQRPADTR
jgi:hypothetical protein